MVSSSGAILHIKGTDRLAHVSDLTVYGEGGVVLDVPLVPASVPRLRNLAASYQRVRWKRIVLRFEPMVPSITSGGYVCGFVPDADDDLSEGAALDRLMAHTGSKMVKAWQAATVSHRCMPDLLYTSRRPKQEARLYSPGRVALVIDSKIAVGERTSAPLSVYIDWEVELHEPCLEGTFTKAGAIEALDSFYTRQSNVGLWWKDGGGGDDPRTKLPGIQFDVVYRSISKRYTEFTDASSGSAVTMAGSFDRFCMTNDGTHGITLWVCDYKGAPIQKYGIHNTWMLEKGDTFVPEPKNLFQGLHHLQYPNCFEVWRPRQEPSSEQSTLSNQDWIVLEKE